MKDVMNLRCFVCLLVIRYSIAFTCSDTKCYCVGGYPEFEFQCPSNHQWKTLVHVAQTSVRIKCRHVTYFDPESLPLYAVGEDVDLEMEDCHLHEDALSRTINRFNVTELKSLRLRATAEPSAVQIVSKYLFKDLQSLIILELKYVNATIEDDFLENLPNLERLYFEANYIQNIRFKYSNKITVLHLSQNFITDIPDYVFKDLVNLKQLHLRDNKLRSLRKASFSGLSQITSLELSRNELEVLHEELFFHMPNLVNLNLRENNLSHISVNLFKHNSKLELLNLGCNPRLVIPDGLFSNLGNLSDLSLDGNLLEEIPLKTLLSLKNLRRLNLRSNRIKTIERKGIYFFEKLVELDVSANQFTMVDQRALMSRSLEKLILRNNLVESFPEQILLENTSLKELDLSSNRISYIHVSDLRYAAVGLTINLSNNTITGVDFGNIDRFKTKKSSNNTVQKTGVILSNNNFICDCRLYALSRYADGEIKFHDVTLLLDDVRCSQPEKWKGELVTNIKPIQITCEKKEYEDCPESCTCMYRPYDDTFVVDCSHRQLTVPPSLLGNYSHSKIQVNLENNLMESGPKADMGYEKVVHLDLSHNRIREFDWVPPKIEFLNLSGNRLTSLSINIIESLQQADTLRNLGLSENSWRCDCAAKDLQNFINIKSDKVNISTVLCSEDNKPLMEKQELDLCVSSTRILVSLLPVLVIFLLLVITYMRYKQYFKVWLFSNGLCMWLVSEEEVDKDKKYDVFVSYAHQDEDFVLTKLLPHLESGPAPFRTCIHIRDWMPGEMITTQVQRSVLDSRRTLVVLSNNFLESCWGRLEFKTAHVTAIKDNCSRVIVVKYGDLDEKNLDDDLKSYLKTNTYVEWGSPWFWEKLQYALPHRRSVRHRESSKFANAMLKIDDMFELNAEAMAVPDSTPPILSLDQSVFKNNKSVDFLLSESPLIKR